MGSALWAKSRRNLSLASLGLIIACLLMGSCGGRAWAQKMIQSFPREVFSAKTVAIVNNTHNDAVSQGAIEALKRWGHFTLTDDSDLADITLIFGKKANHAGTSTQTTGDDGKTNSNYSMSFSSSVDMSATVKGTDKPFYTTSTDESKKKAGNECVRNLQSAFDSAR